MHFSQQAEFISTNKIDEKNQNKPVYRRQTVYWWGGNVSPIFSWGGGHTEY